MDKSFSQAQLAAVVGGTGPFEVVGGIAGGIVGTLAGAAVGGPAAPFTAAAGGISGGAIGVAAGNSLDRHLHTPDLFGLRRPSVAGRAVAMRGGRRA